MGPAMHHLSIRAVRADALFVSALQRSDDPSPGQIRRAVAAAVRCHGRRGCAGRVAQEFGDHPELAAARMRWARAVTREVFGAGTPRPRRLGAPTTRSAGRAGRPAGRAA